jgi:hypothetical protein
VGAEEEHFNHFNLDSRFVYQAVATINEIQGWTMTNPFDWFEIGLGIKTARRDEFCRQNDGRFALSLPLNSVRG